MAEESAPAQAGPTRARKARRILGATLLVGVGLVLAVAVEAVVRARIPSPEERLPSALYTRPIPWGSSVPRTPLPLGTLDGSPLEQRVPAKLEALPDHLIQAVLAVEDQRFYRHHGLDVRRIGGALLANLKAGDVVQGGSTLTQQLAKNLYLDARRTPLRKLREGAMALVLERRYTKSKILESYLNEIYLGQQGGRPIHGVGAAARVYFGKRPERMTLAESAMLAGMISAPNRYAPNRNPQLARLRRQRVLDRMVEQNRLTRAAAGRAAKAPLGARVAQNLPDGRWFRDLVLASLGKRPSRRGTAIYTTMDARLQQAAERAVQRGLARLGPRGAEAALVALDPHTGDVLALVGGRDYGTSQFNRATDARRQPGSAFKPIVALTALEPDRGSPVFTLASTVEDTPLTVRTAQGPWEPVNYDRQFHGTVTLRQALEYSFNVPFARIGLQIGPDRIVRTARRLGITSPLREVPSLALGSSEVTLLELTRAYGVLAARGKLAETRILLGQAPHGQPAPAVAEPFLTRAADPAVAFLVTSALQGVVTRGTGSALNQTGRFPGLAGKTGTSSEWRDAWFLAYSPDLVVGTWVGFDDGQSLRLTGSAAALPIAAAFLADAASSQSWNQFEVPDGITEGYVTAGGGWPWDCGEPEYFLTGTEPSGRSCFRWERPSLDEYREHLDDLRREAFRALRGWISRVRGNQ